MAEERDLGRVDIDIRHRPTRQVTGPYCTACSRRSWISCCRADSHAGSRISIPPPITAPGVRPPGAATSRAHHALMSERRLLWPSQHEGCREKIHITNSAEDPTSLTPVRTEADRLPEGDPLAAPTVVSSCMADDRPLSQRATWPRLTMFLIHGCCGARRSLPTRVWTLSWTASLPAFLSASGSLSSSLLSYF